MSNIIWLPYESTHICSYMYAVVIDVLRVFELLRAPVQPSRWGIDILAVLADAN